MEYSSGKIEWLTFDLLKPYTHVVHGVFSRQGGASKQAYATLNANDQVGDHPDCVKINREAIRKTLGLPRIIYARQIHGTDVYRMTQQNREDKIPGADALWTTEVDIGLAVTHADCQAAIFYDPVHEAIAVAHVGWKGSVQNFYARVIQTLQQEVGTKPQDLIVCISPSLGPDHAEYKNYRTEFPQEFWDFQVKPKHFDFWEIGRKQLMEAGVLPKKIEISAICTFCQQKDYFSHRRDHHTGRNATVVALRGK